jgi:hypothetical protein
MKRAISNYCFPPAVFSLLFAVLTIFGACQANTPDEADVSRVNEIAGFFDDLPIHPSKALKHPHNESDGDTASVAKTYQSDAAFDEVREFYLERLSPKGWQFIEERELKDRGRFRGERVLEFQKGEFVLSIQFAGERRDSLGWDYAVRIAYPEYNRKKV